jgi:hypothetical protein
MVDVFKLRLGSCHVWFLCSNQLISVIDNYPHHKVFGLLMVHFIYVFYIGFVLLIVLWDITHTVFLQLLACEEPTCDGIGGQYVS